MTDSYSPIDASTPADQILQVSQPARPQDEGIGLRVGNRSEFTLVAPLVHGGADVFRSHVAKAQTEAAYWEGEVGTVHDIRIVLINNDTQVLFSATYSDEFKPYVADVIKFATPWIDYMFTGVAEGYPGLASPDAIPWILKYTLQASVWYASNPDATPREITKSLQIAAAFNNLLDAAQD